ncbi:MAG: hypothetical protein KKC68_01000 [Candidatus Thermoplasmatota archaeon]|nr:hypothetical protein [Candidatus Thermoplasmatota archaeon]MBU1940328.1 hypothetical protein [Candidatus Thermoplasmatota archaeon]
MVGIKASRKFEGWVTRILIVTEEKLIPAIESIHGKNESVKLTNVLMDIKKENDEIVTINPSIGLYEQYLEEAKQHNQESLIGGFITFNESEIMNLGL